MASNPVSKISEEEYLAIDRAAEFRSEFIDGEIFAMSGGTLLHSLIQGNLFAELHLALRTSPCRPFGSDSRVRVSSRACVYPDVTVVCGQQQPFDDHDDILTKPVAIFEVLSPSTEKYDRGLKSRLYRSIDSLRDHVLVDQEQVWVEQYSRQENGIWTLREYGSPDEELKIEFIGVAIPLRRIYERTSILGATG